MLHNSKSIEMDDLAYYLQSDYSLTISRYYENGEQTGYELLFHKPASEIVKPFKDEYQVIIPLDYKNYEAEISRIILAYGSYFKSGCSQEISMLGNNSIGYRVVYTKPACSIPFDEEAKEFVLTIYGWASFLEKSIETLVEFGEHYLNDKYQTEVKEVFSEEAPVGFDMSIREFGLNGVMDDTISLKVNVITPATKKIMKSHQEKALALQIDHALSAAKEGPWHKTAATKDLEDICVLMLNDKTAIDYQFNTFGELEIIINGQVYNLTLLLLDHPHFSALEFSDDFYRAYEKYVQSNAKAWDTPIIRKAEGDSNIPPSEKEYAALDPEGKHHYLHLAEKYALTMYSDGLFSEINLLLRSGLLGDLDDKKIFIETLKKTLLTACVAAKALSKNSKFKNNRVNENVTNEMESQTRKIVIRCEETVHGVNRNRDTRIKKGEVIPDFAFTSTSQNVDFAAKKSVGYTFINYHVLNNQFGKSIMELASHQNRKIQGEEEEEEEEEEYLFSPGQQYVPFRVESEMCETAEMFGGGVIKMVDQEGNPIPNITILGISKGEKVTYHMVPIKSVNDDVAYDAKIIALRKQLLQTVEHIDLTEEVASELLALISIIKSSFNEKLSEDVIHLIQEKCFLFYMMNESVDIVFQAEFVLNCFLKYAYLDKDICDNDLFIQLGDIIISKPNHGLAHTLHVTCYILMTLYYFSQHAADPQFKKFCDNLLHDHHQRRELQSAALFSVTGRQSEVSRSVNKERYEAYREKSFENFDLFVKNQQKQGGMLGCHPDDYYGALAGPQEFYTGIGKDDTKQQYLANILFFSHTLDLMRCSELDRYNKEMALFDVLVNQSEEQNWLLKRIFLTVQEVLIITGDRLKSQVDDELINQWEPKYETFGDLKDYDDDEYGDEFIESSTNPKSTLKNIYEQIAMLFPEISETYLKTIKRKQNSARFDYLIKITHELKFVELGEFLKEKQKRCVIIPEATVASTSQQGLFAHTVGAGKLAHPQTGGLRLPKRKLETQNNLALPQSKYRRTN